MLVQQLNFITRGAKTKRFHTSDTLTSQTVGEHSFGVAWIAALIAPDARKELILAALAHDLAEHRVGDVPSPVKRANPALKAALDVQESGELEAVGLNYEGRLTEGEALILKFADMLDGMLFCVRERRMGSTLVVPIYDNFHSYAASIQGVPERGIDLFKIIERGWRKAHERE